MLDVCYILYRCVSIKKSDSEPSPGFSHHNHFELTRLYIANHMERLLQVIWGNRADSGICKGQ